MIKERKQKTASCTLADLAVREWAKKEICPGLNLIDDQDYCNHVTIVLMSAASRTASWPCVASTYVLVHTAGLSTPLHCCLCRLEVEMIRDVLIYSLGPSWWASPNTSMTRKWKTSYLGLFLYFFGKLSLKNRIKFDLIHSLGPS